MNYDYFLFLKKTERQNMFVNIAKNSYDALRAAETFTI